MNTSCKLKIYFLRDELSYFKWAIRGVKGLRGIYKDFKGLPRGYGMGFNMENGAISQVIKDIIVRVIRVERVVWCLIVTRCL